MKQSLIIHITDPDTPHRTTYRLGDRTIHMTWLNYPRQTAQHLFDNVPL